MIPVCPEHSLAGQDSAGPVGGTRSARETMAEIALRDQQGASPRATPPRRHRRKGRPLQLHPSRGGATTPGGPEPGVLILPKSPQAPGSSFTTTDTNDTNPEGFIPLDAMGSVGPTQIVVLTNVLLKVLDKATGTESSGVPPVSVDTFFGSVQTAGTFATDVRARFDRLSQRWFLGALDGDMGNSTPGLSNQFMLAVSDGPTITSSTVWSFFSFIAGINISAITNGNTTNTQADSEGIGIDASALYLGANLFGIDKSTGSFTYVGSAGYVIQKSSVLGAGPIHVTVFPGLCDENLSGTYSPQGVDNDDPAPPFGFIVGVDIGALSNVQASASTNLKLLRIANPGSSAPTIDQTFNVTVPSYGNSLGVDRLLLNFPVKNPSQAFPIGVPVKGCIVAPPKNIDPIPGVVIGLDDLDQRLTVATIRQGHLWTVHNIDVDQSGAAIPIDTTTGFPQSSSGRDGARWYEITNLSTTPSLLQSGTLFDATAGAGASSYFVPSLAVTGQGHMAVGATRGGPNEFADIAAGGRLAGDPAGATQAGTLLKASSHAYNFDTGDPAQRWGDYSYTCVDPIDNMTVWTFQEFCSGTNLMAVQVIQLSAPPPSLPTTALPPSVPTGTSSILVSLTAPALSGSGLYDPGPGFPNHLTATVSGGVVVNSVSYIDPTHVTLDLDTSGASAGTSANVTLTNPDGQAVTASSFLPIVAPGTASATVTEVTSTAPSGTVGTGASIPIKVAFSEAVMVTGTPTLALSSGGTASYVSGSGSATLTFLDIVAAGDSTHGASLDVGSTQALVLGGATITTGGTAATLTLPIGATSSPPWSLPSQKSIVIDTTPPSTSILVKPSNPSNDTTPTFSFSASQAGCTFQIQVDGGAWSAPTSAATVTIGPPGFAALSEGSHTIGVRAVDPLGNLDPAPPTYTWTIDTTPPVTTILTTPPNPDTNPTPTFTFSANESGCTFETQMDGLPWRLNGGSTTFISSPLGSGSHTFSVRAIDPAGNVDPAPPTYTWTDNVPTPPPSGGGGGGGGCGALGLEGILLAVLLKAVASGKGALGQDRRARSRDGDRAR